MDVTISPADVVGILADGRVSGLMIVLDVCQAASATSAVIFAAARRALQRPREPALGVGALFSAYRFERADDGVFVPILARLLRDGASRAARQVMQDEQWEAFNPHNRRLTLQEIEEAFLLELEQCWNTQPWLSRPDGVRSGRQIRIFPNPCYRAEAAVVNVGRDVYGFCVPTSRGTCCRGREALFPLRL